MHRLAEQTKREGNNMSDQAKAELDKAWNEATLRWEQLKKASAEGWDNARSSWETASEKMKETWQRLVKQ